MIEPISTGFVTIKEAGIYYRIYGFGTKTLLLLHGNGEDWTCFLDLISDFAQDYRILCMDTRGQGHSGRGNAPFTIGQFARDAAYLCKKLDIPSVIPIGFSDGGNVALTMAIRGEIPLDGLITAGANLNPKGVNFFSQLPLIFLAKMFSLGSHFSKSFGVKKELFEIMTRQPNINPDDLSCVNCPALIMAGEKDLIRTSHTELIAGSIPNSKMVLIKNANHFLFTKKNKDAVHSVLRDFLKTLS